MRETYEAVQDVPEPQLPETSKRVSKTHTEWNNNHFCGSPELQTNETTVEATAGREADLKMNRYKHPSKNFKDLCSRVNLLKRKLKIKEERLVEARKEEKISLRKRKFLSAPRSVLRVLGEEQVAEIRRKTEDLEKETVNLHRLMRQRNDLLVKLNDKRLDIERLKEITDENNSKTSGLYSAKRTGFMNILLNAEK